MQYINRHPSLLTWVPCRVQLTPQQHAFYICGLPRLSRVAVRIWSHIASVKHETEYNVQLHFRCCTSDF